MKFFLKEFALWFGLGLGLAIPFLIVTNDPWKFEINIDKRLERKYPCYYSVNKINPQYLGTKWCGGGEKAIEILLERLQTGEWEVDFRKSH